MQQQFRLFRRAGGVFYWQDNDSKKQRSLGTKNRREAERLLHAKNEAHRAPILWDYGLADKTANWLVCFDCGGDGAPGRGFARHHLQRVTAAISLPQ
jgi:hypothetical protein